MRRELESKDALALRESLDKTLGLPRMHAASEVVHVGGGRHVARVETVTSVAVIDAGRGVAVVVVDDADAARSDAEFAAKLNTARAVDIEVVSPAESAGLKTDTQKEKQP